MGCHTWFYKRIPQPTETEVSENAQQVLEGLIDFVKNDAMTNDTWGSRSIEETRQLKIKYFSRQLRQMKKGMQKSLAEDLYEFHGKSTLCLEGVFYTDSEFSDLFRVKDYPEVILKSCKDTLDYLNERGEEVRYYENWKSQLEAFWSMYPDGIIRFG